MSFWGPAQWVIAAYLTAVVVGTPFLRYQMMNSGAQGFVPWRDFWSTWAIDALSKLALVALLYWGGFWS